MLGYKKNYVTIAFNYMLKISKRIISVSKIKRRDGNNNIKEEYL